MNQHVQNSMILGYLCNTKQWQQHSWALNLVIYDMKLYLPHAQTIAK